MYLLINNNSTLVGIFSTKQKMLTVCKAIIKNHIETEGYCGWFHFRYAEVNPDEPYFFKNGKERPASSIDYKAMFSLGTIHNEYFTHEIENDPTTGEILNEDTI